MALLRAHTLPAVPDPRGGAGISFNCSGTYGLTPGRANLAAQVARAAQYLMVSCCTKATDYQIDRVTDGVNSAFIC